MFSKLPLEILSQIFSYLSLSDRLQCNLVCKHWHWAFLDPILHDDQTVLKFEDDEDFLACISNDDASTSLLESEISTAVRHLRLQKISVNIFSVRPLVDWLSLLANIKHLTLSEASIVNESELVVLLKNLKSLNGLVINNARDVFISGGFLSLEEDRADLKDTLSKVTFLDLSCNSPYLTDQLFNRITGCMPNVSHFVLDNTKILSHSGIYKKHYPASVAEFDSPSVLTWQNVMRYLVEIAPHLQTVSFCNSGVPSNGLKNLGQIQGLCLKGINVSKCLDITTESLIDFCRHQCNLTKLKIDGCRRILADNPDLRLALFETMSKSVQVLSMKGLSCPRLEDSFQLMDKLTFLDASECDFPSSHLFNGLHQNKQAKKSLKTLKLNSFGISSSESFLRVIPELQALTTLELKNGHEGVTDAVVQSIVKHCHNLSELNLSNCGQLTDAAFTQVNEPSFNDEQSQQKGSPSKIFLGSKAEAELLSEIKRIQYINSASASATLSPVIGLRKIKRLEMVNVRITDVTLKLAFQFDSLRYVNLSLCKFIGDEGFRHLADQNPHIEELIAKQCNLSGETVLHIAEKCPRLRRLDLEACLSITDDSMQKLPRFCRKGSNLQFIDLSFCRKVRTATIENVLMAEIPSLRHVGMRGLALAELLDDDESEKNTAIPSVPLPPPFKPL